MVIREEGSTTNPRATAGLNKFQEKIAQRLLEKMREEKPKKKFFGLVTEKEKPSKLEKKLKLSNAKKKKGYVTQIIIRRNRNIDIKKIQGSKGFTYMKDNNTYHVAEADHILLFNNNPVIIQPEWSIDPLTPEYFDSGEHAQKAREDGRTVDAQEAIIKFAEQGNLKPKNKIDGRMILYGVLGIIAIYVIYQFLAPK